MRLHLLQTLVSFLQEAPEVTHFTDGLVWFRGDSRVITDAFVAAALE